MQDAEQCRVIHDLIRDLNMDIEVHFAPLHRH